MKLRRFIVFAGLLTSAIAHAEAVPPVAPAVSTQTKNSPEVPVATLIKEKFGPNVTVVSDIKPAEFKGDFNGDGFQDLAVLVSPKGKRSELAAGVNVVVTSEGPATLPATAVLNGKNSLAILHGSATGLKDSPPNALYLIYDFAWVGWNGAETGGLILLPKAKQKRDKAGYAAISAENYVSMPKANIGDALVVPTEAGINTLLYWDGKKYRFWFDPSDTP